MTPRFEILCPYISRGGKKFYGFSQNSNLKKGAINAGTIHN